MRDAKRGRWLKRAVCGALCLLLPLPFARPCLAADGYAAAQRGPGAVLQLTDDELAFVAQSGPFTVALNVSRSPFSSLDVASGEFSGICVDVLGEIAALSGLSFEFVPQTPGLTTPELLAGGGIDIVCGVERDNFAESDAIAATDAFMESAIVPIARAGRDLDIGSSLTVAVPASFQALKRFLALHYPNLTQVEYVTSAECLDAVAGGRADLFIQNTHLISLVLQRPKYERLELIPIEIMTEHTVMALPSGADARLLSILNKAIRAIGPAEVNNIIIRHTFASPYRYSAADFVYKFQVQLIVISGLTLLCFALLMLMAAARRRSAERLEEKNRLLAVAMEQAQAASAAKGRFLSSVSHEMRTPLNAIIGFIELSKGASYDKTVNYLTNADTAARQLLSVINDVLDISSIESGRLRVASAPFNFKRMLASLADIYGSQCRQKGLHFEVRMKSVTEDWLVGDELRVNQILINLLGNAVKFTERGHIWLTVEQTSVGGDKLFFRFEVSDTGCGMGADMLERLFRPFEQESASTARKYGGSGLGLSIVKSLSEMMGGTVEVKSAPGAGTTFTVALPFGSVEPHAGAPVLASGAQLHVLAVDDDENELDYVSRILSHMGVRHACAAGGSEALAALEAAAKAGDPYNVCLVDWRMPELSGEETTRLIRAKYGKDVAVIVASAYDYYQAGGAAKSAGADVFLSKPLFPSSLFDLFMSLTGGKLAAAEDKAAAWDFSGRRVLLAEDNALNQVVANGYLAKDNVAVELAVNGREVVDMFLRSAPGYYDAILMDIQMPVMDGLEATRAIRASSHPSAGSIPIIAQSADAFNEDIARALAAGMNAHVAKPIEPDALAAALAKAFGREARRDGGK